MNEFNLSKKILKRIIDEASALEKDNAMWLDSIKTEEAINKEITEFIRRLKEVVKEESFEEHILEEIDKLAGNRLVEEQKKNDIPPHPKG